MADNDLQSDQRQTRTNSNEGAAPPSFTLGGRLDSQSVTADWQPLQPAIDGVAVREVRNVVKDNGYLTELWRADWLLPHGTAIGQVFQVAIEPGAVSAWHVHVQATDRLFANWGNLKIVLYDAREESPTHGRINVLRCGALRPMLIVVPPGVWHGVHNIGSERAALTNMPDRPYQYDAPDHWRLPAENDRVPYSFAADSRRAVDPRASL